MMHKPSFFSGLAVARKLSVSLRGEKAEITNSHRHNTWNVLANGSQNLVIGFFDRIKIRVTFVIYKEGKIEVSWKMADGPPSRESTVNRGDVLMKEDLLLEL